MDAAPDDVAPPRRSLPRRFAPLILVAGVIASAFILIPRLPRERRVELRLEDASTIVGVQIDWLASSRRAPSPEVTKEDPVQGASWRFAEGSAPPSVTAKVRLPDGPYDLEIVVERVGRADVVHRSITLGDADQITIPVR
jgi:hypothetical protein